MVDAVLSLDEDLSLDMIGVKKIPGGALEVPSDLVSSELLKNLFLDPISVLILFLTGFFPGEGSGVQENVFICWV